VLPSFAISDPEITAATKVEHLLCMCTGVPRRMEENQYILYESSFIGKTLTLKTGPDGNPSMTLNSDEATYVFIPQTNP
jgi:hypothetical protein